MANPEHVEIVKQGTRAINKWRAENPKVQLDLSGADLSNLVLRKADLRGADLSEADLSGVNLTRADITGANLKGIVKNGLNLNNVKCDEKDLLDCGIVFVPLVKGDTSLNPILMTLIRIIWYIDSPARFIWCFFILLLFICGAYMLVKLLFP